MKKRNGSDADDVWRAHFSSNFTSLNRHTHAQTGGSVRVWPNFSILGGTVPKLLDSWWYFSGAP